MNPWEQLLEVQRLDTSLDQLAHRSRSIPERAELEELPAQAAEVESERAARQRRLDELETSQQRLEDEVGTLTDRRDRSQAALYGGTVAGPKELSAMQDEIAAIGRRIGVLEDEILEIMELIEPVRADLDALADRRRELDEKERKLTEAIGDAEAVIDEERREVLRARDAAVADVGEDLLAKYERARSQLGGVAVARLVGAVCEGCHINLSAVEVDRIKHLPIDEPVTCEECGRYLVR